MEILCLNWCSGQEGSPGCSVWSARIYEATAAARLMARCASFTALSLLSVCSRFSPESITWRTFEQGGRSEVEAVAVTVPINGKSIHEHSFVFFFKFFIWQDNQFCRSMLTDLGLGLITFLKCLWIFRGSSELILLEPSTWGLAAAEE